MPKSQNPWTAHVKLFQRTNGISFTEALKTAGKTYKKTTNKLVKPFFKKSRKGSRRVRRGRRSHKMRGGEENASIMGPKSIGGEDLKVKVVGGEVNSVKINGGNTPIPK